MTLDEYLESLGVVPAPDGTVSKSQFATLLGRSSPGVVSQWVNGYNKKGVYQEPKLHHSVVGEGRKARILVVEGLQELRDHLDISQQLAQAISVYDIPTETVDEPQPAPDSLLALADPPLVGAEQGDDHTQEPSTPASLKPQIDAAALEAKSMAARKRAADTAAAEYKMAEAKLSLELKAGNFILKADMAEAAAALAGVLVSSFDNFVNDASDRVASELQADPRKVRKIHEEIGVKLRKKLVDNLEKERENRQLLTAPAIKSEAQVSESEDDFIDATDAPSATVGGNSE